MRRGARDEPPHAERLDFKRVNEVVGDRRHAISPRAPQQNAFCACSGSRLRRHYRLRSVDNVGCHFFAAMGGRQCMNTASGRKAHETRIDLVGLSRLWTARSIGIVHRNPDIGDDAGLHSDRVFGEWVRLTLAPCVLAQSRSRLSGERISGQAIANSPPQRPTACTHDAATLWRRRPRPPLLRHWSAMLFERHNIAMIWQGLRLVGESIYDRHAGMIGKLAQFVMRL